MITKVTVLAEEATRTQPTHSLGYRAVGSLFATSTGVQFWTNENVDAIVQIIEHRQGYLRYAAR